MKQKKKLLKNDQEDLIPLIRKKPKMDSNFEKEK